MLPSSIASGPALVNERLISSFNASRARYTQTTTTLGSRIPQGHE
jgi:hypothetical protein